VPIVNIHQQGTAWCVTLLIAVVGPLSVPGPAIIAGRIVYHSRRLLAFPGRIQRSNRRATKSPCRVSKSYKNKRESADRHENHPRVGVMPLL
jgi:hypothetical protein